MTSKLFVSGLFLAICTLGYAQTATPINKSAPQLLDEQKDLQSQLLPLDSIIAIAIKNSPSVRFQEDLVKTAAAELDYNKKLWASNVIGFANYSGGNQNIVTNGSATGGTLSSSNVTTGLRVGLQVNLPLIELVGRKPRINSYKNTLNSTISKKAEAEQSIKQLVIDLYYKLIYSGNLLSIRSEAKQSAINQYSIAEKQFKDGIIEIGELSRLKTIEVNARADYEEAKRQFSTNYSEMEPLVGVDVQQLIIKK